MYDELVKALRFIAKEKCSLSGGQTGICKEAADAIEELSKQLDDMNEANIALYGALPKWIPVTDRLPEDGKHVLVYAGFFQPYIESAYYCDERKWRFTYDDTEIVGVSHWMPLPEPPKEE